MLKVARSSKLHSTFQTHLKGQFLQMSSLISRLSPPHTSCTVPLLLCEILCRSSSLLACDILMTWVPPDPQVLAGRDLVCPPLYVQTPVSGTQEGSTTHVWGAAPTAAVESSVGASRPRATASVESSQRGDIRSLAEASLEKLAACHTSQLCSVTFGQSVFSRLNSKLDTRGGNACE